MHVYIEGIPGSGKSTLLRQLSQKLGDYPEYWEGDLSPVSLAWCSCMTEEQYRETMELFPEQAEEIRHNTRIEEKMRIVSYTRILAENRAFYGYMEQFEVFGGRKSAKELKEIVIRRSAKCTEERFLGESSFFQYFMEEFLLYAQLGETEILDFYRAVYEAADPQKFLLLYLETEDPVVLLEQLKQERTDTKGRQIWYEMMLRYLNASPYGKAHGQPFQSISDMAAYYRRRTEMEKLVMREVLGDRCLRIPAKAYDLDALAAEIRSREKSV